jgi:hypothetical protein
MGACRQNRIQIIKECVRADSAGLSVECRGGAILPEVLSRSIHLCPGSFHSQAFSSLSHREDIWFDDVDPDDIEDAIGPEAAMLVRKRLGQKKRTISLEKEQAFGG